MRLCRDSTKDYAERAWSTSRQCRRFHNQKRCVTAIVLPANHQLAIGWRHNAITTNQEVLMRVRPPNEEKLAALHARHAANPRPQAVTDPAFTADDPFFDANDVVQVKYEMLRRVQHDHQSVTHTARTFGFSRPAFYQAQAVFAQQGLPGLLPQRPGPKRAHKLTESVVTMLRQALTDDPTLGSDALAQLLRDQLGLSVHPRSIERALARHARKRQSPHP